MGLKAVSNRLANGVLTGTDGDGYTATIACWGVPFIIASSGTMGDNGAVSGMTALPRTYSNGAWLYLPAAAIVAGGAAGWYWFVASSTTAGTVYNSTYTTGIPTAGTATAFATTGPGAFAGVTTEHGITIPVPANALGTGARRLAVNALLENNNSAGAKTGRIRYTGSAGTAYTASAQTTVINHDITARIWNLNATNLQFGIGRIETVGAGIAQTQTTGSADTTAATELFVSGQKAVATDHSIINCGIVLLAL